MPETYLALDLWMSLGLPSQEFDRYFAENGWTDTWSSLLDCCRHLAGRRTCLALLGFMDFCVLSDGHTGPHYGADDVGQPNDLLPRAMGSGRTDRSEP